MENVIYNIIPIRAVSSSIHNIIIVVMIIGSGDISSVLTDRDDLTFFASGVSDSSCSDLTKFKREADLLFKMPRHQHLVYFSTLSIYYGHSPYVAHKKRMELLVRDLFQSYTIVRIGNIDWGKNPHTLINYLRANPDAMVQEVYRHVISKDEFLYWMDMIKPGTRNEMNVPGVRWWVPDLVRSIDRQQAAELNPILTQYFPIRNCLKSNP